VERVHVLGVPIDPLTRAQAVEAVKSLLADDVQHQVVTVNSEMLVAAAYDGDFRTTLLQSSLNVPDSAGVVAMARWTGQHLPERVAGVDLITDLCAHLDHATPVFMLGAQEGIAERAFHELRRLNENVRIVGTYAGSPKAADAAKIVALINEAKPQLLLVAYGAPAQELWIASHLKELSSVRVAIGVGGTFDFLAGAISRAPRWMRGFWLEWSWRLLLEPRRLPRIVRAVVVFPWLVWKYGRNAPAA